MSGFGALREFDFDHLDHFQAGFFSEQLFVKTTVRITAAKIARANLPDQITSMFEMIGADASFTGVVCKAVEFCSLVSSQNGILA
jgi:hypothetical protein